MQKHLSEEELKEYPEINLSFRRSKFDEFMGEVERYANEGKTSEEVINIMLGENASPFNKKNNSKARYL